MEIPTPPTDSLYKFKAIGGIVIALGSLYIASQTTHEILKSAAKIREDFAVLRAEMENIKARYKEEDKRHELLGKELAKLPPRSKATEDQKYAVDWLAADLERIRSNVDQNVDQLDDKNKNVSRLEASIVNLNFPEVYAVLAACLIAVLFGGNCIVTGFREWRIKIQEPQDELVQIQLAQARLALAKARKVAAEPAEATETPALSDSSSPSATPSRL